MKCLFISILSFILLFAKLNTCKALDVDRLANARAYSMGNTSSVLPGFYNPASSAFAPSRYLALEYINKFGLKELSSFAGIVNYPNDYLNSALYVSKYGFDAYHETVVGLNVYKKLSKRIALGARMNYMSVYYSDKEDNATVLTGDVGVLISMTEAVNISFMLANPFRTELKMNDDKFPLPNKLLMGISYQLDKTFLLTSEIEQDFALPAIYKVGLEFTPIKELSIRSGMWTKPFTPSFGVGVQLHPFSINLAFSHHPVLGFQSCCGLQFNF